MASEQWCACGYVQVDLMLPKLYKGKKVNIRFEGLYIMGLNRIIFFLWLCNVNAGLFLSMQRKLEPLEWQVTG